MERKNGTGNLDSSIAQYTTGMLGLNGSSQISSTSSAVFPGCQNYTNLYPAYPHNADNEPVNLSNTSNSSAAGQPQYPTHQETPSQKQLAHTQPEQAQVQKQAQVRNKHSQALQQQLHVAQQESFGAQRQPHSVPDQKSFIHQTHHPQRASHVTQQSSHDTQQSSHSHDRMPAYPQQVAQSRQSLPQAQHPSHKELHLTHSYSPHSHQIQSHHQLKQSHHYHSPLLNPPDKSMPSAGPSPPSSSFPLSTEGHLSTSTPPMPELPVDPMSVNSNSSPSTKLPIQALHRPRTPSVSLKKSPKAKPAVSTYPLILPLPSAATPSIPTLSIPTPSIPTLSKSAVASHMASASPAIQAALNQPVVGRQRAKRRSKTGVADVPAAIGTNGATAGASDTVTGIGAATSTGVAVGADASMTVPHSALQQAPTMMRYLSQPPLQSSSVIRPATKPAKQGRRKSQHKQLATGVSTQFQSIKSIQAANEDRFVMASRIAATSLSSPTHCLQAGASFTSEQFAVVPSPRTAMTPSISACTINDNWKRPPNKTFEDLQAMHPLPQDSLAPVHLREYEPIQPSVELPNSPRSLIAMRLYEKLKKKQEELSQNEANSKHGSQCTFAQQISKGHTARPSISATTVTPATLTSSALVTSVTSTFSVAPLVTCSATGTSAISSTTTSVTEFDWELYLKLTDAKAAPHSAFRHLEASLMSGFQVGMKVETPLRGIDSDKYWLATIVAVYGSLVKLRFDGYGDRSKDFTVLGSSGQLHPIGWCAKSQKSLLPPADIRHTQKQWKNFLLNALQGAKTVPTYLLGSHCRPWIADRIRQGMRLEIQHEKVPTAVWVAKVISNVGGRMKLRYEGSIDDVTDFWLFYLDRRIHPCGWSAASQNKGYIYKPPDEIKESFEYDAWSKILQEVTRDSSIDRIPAEIFQVYPELPIHSFTIGQVLEAVHPSGLFIGPAQISSIINTHYFLVEHLDLSGQPTGDITCHYSQESTLLPVGWCTKNDVTLGKPTGINNNQVSGQEFSWVKYMSLNAARPTKPSDFCEQVAAHQFVAGQKLEAVNPAKKSEICVATVSRIVGRLMWLEIYTTPASTDIVIVDVMSLCIFPAGWCSSNNYPLTVPQVDLSKQEELMNSTSPSSCPQEGTGPKIYFNHGCFSGPFLSKSRILDLPESLNISHVRVMVKEMLNFIISVGYKSSYILKLLQRTDTSNPQLQRQIIKTKCKGKSYEGYIEVCTKRNELKSFCKQICKRLRCCPNLVSTEKVKGRCSERCETMTKTQYTNLCFEARKPGRPSVTNPDGSKRKGRKRKKRKKVFTPKRNLYIPKHEYTGGISDNCSASSNSYDDQLSPALGGSNTELLDASLTDSPLRKVSPVPLGSLSLPASRPSSATGNRPSDLHKDHPLYQLQLTSVKKDIVPAVAETSVVATEESHQYQIVKEKKKRRGRMSKLISPEAGEHSDSFTLPSNKRYPTVPPLKIRRLELSPPQPPSAETFPPATMTSTNCSASCAPTTSVVSSSSQQVSTPLMVQSGPPTTTAASLRIEPSKNRWPDLLLKAGTPYPASRSALAFTQVRLHVEDRDKVVLTDNPLYWDVSKLLGFIAQTDCSSLSQNLSDHDIDGQAFMMLVLPTVQEELGLKLGPALKLCHHVQRLKLAFYETFHPDGAPKTKLPV